MNPHSGDEIAQEIISAHQAFLDFVRPMSKDEFEFSPDDVKWSAAQQMEHVDKALKAVLGAMKKPKFLLKWKFGQANRPSRTYESLVKRYQEKAAAIPAGITASKYAPHKTSIDERKRLMATMTANSKSLAKVMTRLSDKHLDTVILPHPLLGKITLREMGFFTIYHVLHHQRDVKQLLVNH